MPIRTLALRLAVVPPLVLLIVTTVYFLVRLAPGDPAELRAGLGGGRETVEALRHEMGLDRPLPEQYVNFVLSLIRGDMGRSLRTGQEVNEQVALSVPPTVLLAVSSMGIAIVLGVFGGAAAASRRGSRLDGLVLSASSIGVAVPTFWVALVAIVLFGVKLGWLPVTGYGSWRNLILPASVLSINTTAYVARLIRSELIDQLSQDYVRTARAKGLREAIVFLRHALPNALLPTLTVVGLRFGELLGGAVIIETIFAWPGLGSLMYSAILARDYTVIQGAAIVVALGFVGVSLALDLAYVVVNPTLRGTT